MTSNGTTPKVALVTGGASGMGLSVVEHLVTTGWHVTVLDLNSNAGEKHAARLGPAVTFIKTDAADYEQLSSAFVQTYAQHQQLDFVFANAGIGDLQNFYEPVADRDDGSPAKPNSVVVDICLMHVIWASWLALHYFRKNPNKAGKIVSTSSMCGLYPGDNIPLYTAAKHGVVGLTRAMARRLEARGEHITVNCLCPGLVDTGLTHDVLVPIAPDSLLTPHATIVKAVMSFLEDDSKNGLAAECSVNNIIYRVQDKYGDDDAEALMSGKAFEEFAKRARGEKAG